MRSLPLFCMLIGVASCNTPGGSDDPRCQVYYQHHFTNQFPGKYRYDVHPNFTTPSGIQVDTSGQAFDALALDRQTDEVEAGLREAFGDPPMIPPEYVMPYANGADAHTNPACDSPTFPLPIMRECLVVKIAADYTLTQDGSQQMLPAPADPQGCYDKGLCLDANGKPEAECDCHWRAGIQDNRYIVITPSQYLYKDPLIRFVTGCNNSWSKPLAKYANPSVPPLP